MLIFSFQFEFTNDELLSNAKTQTQPPARVIRLHFYFSIFHLLFPPSVSS